MDVYCGTALVASSQVSSGKPGYATPAGVYSILEKQRWHESNIYSGAPMPWLQRITWSGMALHGGVVPGYPASHGCVRQAFNRVFDAPVSFKIPDRPLGTHVYTAMKFALGDTKTQWTAITIEGPDAASTLDRIEIPDEIRQDLGKADPGVLAHLRRYEYQFRESLPNGGDFLVLAKDTTAKVAKGITAQPTEAPVETMRRPTFRRYHQYPSWFQHPPWISPW